MKANNERKATWLLDNVGESIPDLMSSVNNPKYLFIDVETLSVALAVLELTVWNRLA